MQQCYTCKDLRLIDCIENCFWVVYQHQLMVSVLWLIRFSEFDLTRLLSWLFWALCYWAWQLTFLSDLIIPNRTISIWESRDCSFLLGENDIVVGVGLVCPLQQSQRPVTDIITTIFVAAVAALFTNTFFCCWITFGDHLLLETKKTIHLTHERLC